MPIYKIPVFWQMDAEIEIEAECFENALDQAREEDLPDGEYCDGSFEVNVDFAYDLNKDQIEEDKKPKDQMAGIVDKAFPTKEE